MKKRIVGVILLIVGLFFSTIIFSPNWRREPTYEIPVVAFLLVIGGVILTASGGRARGGKTEISGTVTSEGSGGRARVEGLPIFKEEMKRESTEYATAFSGTVVGEPFELDLKKGGYGQQDKFKVGVKVQRYDEDGNPLGVTEIVLDERDNWGALQQGDSVWVRGKWRGDGRLRAKEATNVTSKTTITRRGGWVKKVAGLIILLFILFILYLLLSGQGLG